MLGRSWMNELARDLRNAVPHKCFYCGETIRNGEGHDEGCSNAPVKLLKGEFKLGEEPLPIMFLLYGILFCFGISGFLVWRYFL